MTRAQLNIRLNDVTAAQLEDLKALGYSQTSAIVVALDRFWQQECKNVALSGAECGTMESTNRKESTMDYRIDREKLEEVTALLNQQVDPRAEEHVVEATICGDWHEGQEHQDWIDEADPQEIVDWLASFYQD